MTQENFISNFANLFDDIDASSITLETKFRDIEGWSSLIALSVFAMCDEEYDIQLERDVISKSTTVGDLYKAVSAKL